MMQPFVIVTDHVPAGLAGADGGRERVEDFMTECCHRWLGALSRAFGGDSGRRGGRRNQWDDCFSFHAKEGLQLARATTTTTTAEAGTPGTTVNIAAHSQVLARGDGDGSGATATQAAGELLYVDKRMRADVKVLLNDVPRSRPDCFNRPTVQVLSLIHI